MNKMEKNMNQQLHCSYNNSVMNKLYIPVFMLVSSVLLSPNTYQSENINTIDLIGPIKQHGTATDKTLSYQQDGNKIRKIGHNNYVSDDEISPINSQLLLTSVDNFYQKLSSNQKNLDERSLEILIDNIDELYI